MADDKQKNADFIGHVVGDPKNPQETRMLTGWFGESGEEGYRRLYTDAELSNYVDIPDDAILHSESLKDVQPSGSVIVWIKSDAALKQGGSASSRAARFLQGQVQQDFASAGAAGSLEKAGLRCATQVPCGEPTGFTGECTNQPEVGGAWPCITAIPHCFEVTGFTGKCTHAPWPNPTRYIGCTQLHCPTHDLTHIPHICNIVASGNPGCVVINPPQGGDPAQKAGAAADAEAIPLPATEIPGCGYTKSWGVCETHLLGCGYTKEWGNQCPTHLPDCPTAAPGCGWSRNPVCTDLPGCNWTKQPAICHQTVSQGMVPCTGPLPVDAFGAAAPVAALQPASVICATNIACYTHFCFTRNSPFCPTGICPTRTFPECFPHPSPICPITPGCPFGPGGGGDPAQHFAAFGAAGRIVPNTQAPGCLITEAVPCPTTPHGCTVPPTSPDFGCTKSGPACPTTPPACIQTQPQTQCTQSGPQCPTSCGPECQSQQPNCTSIGQACGHNPCTIDPIQCHTPGFECTMICTHAGPQCVTPTPPVCNNPNAGAQAFAARAAGPQPLPLTPVGCPASDFVACSQFGGCQTIPNGDCTFFGCPSLPQQFAAAGPGGGCTQSGPQCPTHAKPQCTFVGPACPPTPATICTQFAPCPTHQKPCHTPGFECTMFCTQGAPGCPHTIQNAACVGPITIGGPQCPVHSGFNCPSAIGCQSIACQSIACHPGGGGEQQAFAQQAVGAAQSAATVCTQVGPLCQHTSGPTICTQIGPQCPHTAGCPTPLCTHIGAFCQHTSGPTICTQIGPQCPHTAGCPTPLCTHIGAFCQHTSGPTICTQIGPQCPHTAGCPTPLCTQLGCPNTLATLCTQTGPQCPPASGFNCPSQLGCQSIACGQSIACQSIACQPGGGEQQAFGAAFDQSTEFCPTSGGCGGVAQPQAAFGAPQTLATVCTQVGVGCPHTHGCPTPGIDCTVFCTHVGPHCPPTPATVCTQSGPQCHTHLHPICPTGGVDCTVVICTHVGPLCPPNTHPPQCPPPTSLCHTVAGPHCPPHTIQGPACPVLTTGGPQCPPASGFNCPSVAGCQSIACGQSIACQPGGGGQQEAFAARAIGGGPLQPTPATHCFVCDPQAAVGVPYTQIIVQCNPSLIDACPTRQIVQCNPSVIDACPSRLCTHQLIQCNPSIVDACPTRIGCPTQNPAQCPPNSGFNCPSQLGCQSIACQSAACQPGGGEQQAFAARTGVNCTILYCQYVTQVSCTRFPCNPYTALWVCNYPN
jgi:hypothetical protein